MKQIKIGIFGHYGNQNLGDEAIIEATIQNLRLRIPDVELVGFSINPFDTQRRYNIPSFPIRYRADYFQAAVKTAGGPAKINNTKTNNNSDASPNNSVRTKPIKRPLPVRILRGIASRLFHGTRNLIQEISFLKASHQQLQDVDLLLVCGSNQFLDNFGGSWGFPYTILKWTLLAKASGTKVAFVSVGAGPIYRKLSYWLFAPAVRRADYLSYRDDGSKQLMEQNISRIEGAVYPDLAHSLIDHRRNTFSNEKKVIAINPMPVYDSRYWYQSDQSRVDHYINAVAQLAVKLINKGYHVLLFNTQRKDMDSIDSVLSRIGCLYPELKDDERLLAVQHATLDELLDTLTKVDIVVPTRFHGTILPLRLHIPTFGITYHRKARELIDDIGLTGCYVDIENFSIDELNTRFFQFLEQSEGYKAVIEKNLKPYLTQLAKQWDDICSLVYERDPKRAL